MESASVKCNSEEASVISDSFITSIKAELALTPKDLHLHKTLLKRYLSINEVDKAFDHAYNVEFRDKIFKNNLSWYKILNEILDSDKNEGWLYQVLLLTVRERICSLNFLEIIRNGSVLTIEDTEFLYAYDEAIYKVISLGPSVGLEMFHTAMLEHHKGQIALHSATILLIKKGHRESPQSAITSLMLIAWQQVPSNLRRNWLRHSPEKQVLAVNRWYIEGTYRCSQAGHYCLHFIKTLSLQSFRIYCYDEFHYHVYLYAEIAKTSNKRTYFGSGAIGPHSHILPKQFEVEAYDKDAQKEYPYSLNHMVWTLLKYEKMADFECTLFDKLNFSSMDSEHAFNKLDIYAFLYCVTLTARNNGIVISTLPANITSICSGVQAKWWECAYEYYTHKLGSEWIDIDATFTNGIQIIRCIGNNKLDPELLYNLGCIFSARAETSTDIKETHQLKERASLYYLTAMLFLQKIFNTSVENVSLYRDITMFNYVCKDMDDIKMKHLIKECKIGIIKNSLTYGEYQTLYNLAHTYKSNALIFNDLKSKDKVIISLLEAKTFALKALKLLEQETNINYIFYWEVQELIQEIEVATLRITPTKQTARTGFGDKFKPKSGSYCDTCYTNNLKNFNKCACCETPKPKSSTEVKTITSAPSNVIITVGWGDKFKPKTGSWECQSCLVRNEDPLESCTACNSPKDPSKIKTSSKPGKQLDNTTKFKFGVPPRTANATAAVKSESTGQVLFKPDPVEHKKSIFDPPTINDQKSNEEAFISDGTGVHKFSFRIPSNNYNNSEVSAAFGEKADSAPIDFTVKKTNEQTTLAKPVLLPTPQTDSATSFVINEYCKFNYVFKSKMGISPVKAPLKDKGDESDDNKYVAEDECNHSFTPVIPLPDKVEVLTGEENEIELYGHLAKLYRFKSSEWKERGKGIVKILKHKDTGKLRVVMRRDQVLKVCLNHLLSSEVNYIAKDEKSWLFSVNDFSEGALTLEHICLRFKNKEIASQFKEAVDKAVQGGSLDTVNTKPTILTKGDSDDIIFVNEIQGKQVKQKASELMLIPSSVNSSNNFSFGLSQSKTIFSDNTHMSTTTGISSNKSLFDNKKTTQDIEVRSISGDYDELENQLTSDNQGNILELDATTNQTKFGVQPKPNTFGTDAKGGVSAIGRISSQNKAFESGNSLFDTPTPETIFNVASNSEMSKDESSIYNPEEKNPENSETVSFTALSSISDSGFDQSENCKWAGEPILITKKQSAPDGDKSHNDVTGDEAKTGSDEKYTPIVALKEKDKTSKTAAYFSSDWTS